MPFQKGISGNPAGRPVGTGKAGQLRSLLEPFAPDLIQKLVKMALDGDMVAMRLCMERLIAPLPVVQQLSEPPMNIPPSDGLQRLADKLAVWGTSSRNIVPIDKTIR